MSDWQPIETVKKLHGVMLWLFDRNSELIVLGAWAAHMDKWIVIIDEQNRLGMKHELDPILWQPIPERPDGYAEPAIPAPAPRWKGPGGRACSQIDCNSTPVARGLCMNHYQQWRRKAPLQEKEGK